MTYWRQPKPLTTAQRLETVELLRDLAAQLDRPNAEAMLRNIALGTDDLWPADTMGQAVSGGSVGSRTESHALEPPEPLAQRSRILLDDLGRLAPNLRRTLALWSEWDPDRALALCPRCANPLDRRYTRCQWRDPATGVQCGTRENSERRCSTCDEPQPAGRKLRNGECDACRQHRRRTGRARIATSRLALAQGLLTDAGAYTGERENSTAGEAC